MSINPPFLLGPIPVAFTVNNTLANCSTHAETVTVSYGYVGTAGDPQPQFRAVVCPLLHLPATSLGPITLKAGEVRNFSFLHPYPLCYGTVTVTGIVHDAAGATLGAGSASFEHHFDFHPRRP